MRPNLMDWFKQIFHQLTDVETLVRVGGLTAMTIIIFAETGLFFGFFLPGDSLLFLAGAVAAASGINVHLLVGTVLIAAVLGDSVTTDHISPAGSISPSSPAGQWLQARGVTIAPELLQALPYVMTVLVLVLVSSAGARRRLGAPRALVLPYVREER